MNIPEISVIIPYYEGAHWIANAVQSVIAQHDVYPEIIIVDDGSDFPVFEVETLKKYNELKVFRLHHAGKGAAINFGVEQSKAPYICILDQDDRMYSGRLKNQLLALHTDLSLDGVYSDYDRVDEHGGNIDTFVSKQADNTTLLKAMAKTVGLVSLQTLVLKKSIFYAIGGFNADPSLTGLDDSEFFIRLFCSTAKLKYVPGIFSCWTSHESNFSKTHQFNEVRLLFLKHLKKLAIQYPPLRKVLKYFFHHHHKSRGLFFLEHDDPQNALPELASCARITPFDIDAWYLLAKAFYLNQKNRNSFK